MLKTIQGRLQQSTLTPWFRWISVTILVIFGGLGGCGSHVYHIVEPGETLYSISWMYGQDYRTVAKWNDIASPYTLQTGQRLQVAPFADEAVNLANKRSNTGPSSENQRVAPATAARKSVTGSTGQSKAASAPADKPIEADGQSLHKSTKYDVLKNNKTIGYANQDLVWSWPVKAGKIVQAFVADSPGKLGIDVAGTEGQTIYSASNGTVVYSGQGLPSYGKLIIIKHNETFLSAYAHNKKLLVKEGEEIRAGQPIALMGKTGSNHTRLHFQIRRDGKPVDPIQFLPGSQP